MKKLTVIYDSQCGFCTKCRWWMARQPAFVELEFLPKGTTETAVRFPDLTAMVGWDELVAIDEQGQVWNGTDAWIICLYALQEYREWSMRLANPLLKPLARAAFGALSKARKGISALLGMKSDDELRELLQEAGPTACAPGG